MAEPRESLLEYGEIVRCRKSLESDVTPPAMEYHLFAASIVSPKDAAYLRRALRETLSGDDAGEIALHLFTRGGIGNLSGELRPWLESCADKYAEIMHAAPLVLGGCAVNLLDGTSLRSLFEFADQDDVATELGRTLRELGEGRVDELLRRTISDQCASLLSVAGNRPSNRMLRMLRTYVAQDSVAEYLLSHAETGRVEAISGLMLRGEILDWRIFDAAITTSPFDQRSLINAALDNLSRGANLGEFKESTYYRCLLIEDKVEILRGMRNLTAE
jgi:hypothetical protein